MYKKIMSMTLACIMLFTGLPYPFTNTGGPPCVYAGEGAPDVDISYDDFSDTGGLQFNGVSLIENNALRFVSGGGVGQSVFTTDKVPLGANQSFSTSFSFKNISPASPVNETKGGFTFTLQPLGNSMTANDFQHESITPSLSIAFPAQYFESGPISRFPGSNSKFLLASLADVQPNAGFGPTTRCELSAVPYLNGNYDSQRIGVMTLAEYDTANEPADGYHVWIGYDGGEKLLYILCQAPSGEYTYCNISIDLSETMSANEVYAGFMGSLGDAGNTCEIGSWHFKNDLSIINGEKAQVQADEAWLTEYMETLEAAPTEVPYLPFIGQYGSEIRWTSSNPDVVAEDGTVTPPSIEDGNQTVTLTATIAKGSEERVTRPFIITVKVKDADLAAADYEWLTHAVILNKNIDLENITSDLNLPVAGPNGSSISWSSTNTIAAGEDGKVTRPGYFEGDEAVTLTAYLILNGITLEKTFDITVKKLGTSDDEIADADQLWLTAARILNGNSALDNVTGDLSLPVSGQYGSVIVWESDKEAVVSENGTVTRPTLAQGDQTVILTAALRYGDASRELIFTVTVKVKDEDIVSADNAWLSETQVLNGNKAMNHVVGDLDLPPQGNNGSTIGWTTSDSAVVAANGKVTRPSLGSDNVLVALTATISYGSAMPVVRTFVVTVRAMGRSDMEMTEADRQWLTGDQIKQSNSGLNRVFSDLYLPATGGIHESIITWASSDESIISIGGNVTRPVYSQGDKAVRLTATLRKGYADPVTKAFDVTVRALEQTAEEKYAEDLGKVTADYAWLAETVILNGNSAPDNITGNVNLPAIGSNGSMIHWTSTKFFFVNLDGTVRRPSFTQGDQTVALTAEISRGDVPPMIKTFTVVVKALEQSDAEKVSADAAWLTEAVILNGNSALNHVTGNLNLPLTGESGSGIQWLSGNPAVLNTSGAVTRPSYTQGDSTFILSAALTSGTAEPVTKKFTIVVKALAQTAEEKYAEDLEKVNYDFAWLTEAVILNGNIALNHVAGNLNLPYAGLYGSEISWTSDTPAVIAVDGTVTQPTYMQGEKTVALTAAVRMGEVLREKTFLITVIVKPVSSDEEAVAITDAWLTEDLIKKGNSSLAQVTEDLYFPDRGISGSGGAIISWNTSHHGFVTLAGKVSRPMFHLGDTPVTLTATIRRGSVSVKKTFTAILKCLDLTDNESVTEDAKWLKGYDNVRNILGANLSASAVTQDLFWPTSGPLDSAITWRSDAPAFISHEGIVTRPEHSAGNWRVNVTATVTKGGEQVIVPFQFVVLEKPDTAPPAVTGTAPGNHAVNVLWDTNKITVTYNENIVLAQSSGISLEGFQAVQVSPIAQGNKLVVTPLALMSAGENTLLIPAGAITDAAGNPSEAYALKFTVEERLSGNINVISSAPYDTQKDVDINLTEISFRFDSAEIMKSLTFDIQIRLITDKGVLDKATGLYMPKVISQTHTLSGDTVTVKLKEALEPATVYNLVIGSNAVEDRFLNKNSSKVIQFRTKGETIPEPVLPEVEKVYPADGETGVSLNPNIEIYLSGVHVLKIYPFKLTDALGNEYPLYAPYTFDFVGSKLIFKPKAALKPNTEYTLSAPFKNTAVVPFQDEFSTRFTTGAGPQITKTSPATADWNASAGGMIEIYFNTPVTQGVNFKDMVLTDYTGMPVEFVGEESGSKAVLRTVSELDVYMLYTLVIPCGAYQDANGVANTQNKISFYTTKTKLPDGLEMDVLNISDAGFAGKSFIIGVNSDRLASWESYVRMMGYGPISYEWHVDGQSAGARKLFAHTFTVPGEHEIMLTAKDKYGYTYSIKKTVDIQPVQAVRMSLKDSGKTMTLHSMASGTRLSYDFVLRLEQEGYFIFGEKINVNLYREGVLQRLSNYGDGGITLTADLNDSAYIYTYTPEYADSGTYELVFTYNGAGGPQVIRQPFLVSTKTPATTDVFRFRLYEEQSAVYYEELNYVYVLINGERLRANREMYTLNGETFPVYALRKTLQTNVYYDFHVENWWWRGDNSSFYLGKDTDIPGILSGGRVSPTLGIKNVSINTGESELKANTGFYFEGFSTKLVYNVEGDWGGTDIGYYEIAVLKHGTGVSRYDDDPAFRSILVQGHDVRHALQKIAVRPGVQIKDNLAQYWVRMVSAQGYKSPWELCPDVTVAPVPRILGKKLNVSVQEGEYAVNWPTVFDGPIGGTIGFLDDIPVISGGSFGLGGGMPKFEGSFLSNNDIALDLYASGGYSQNNKTSQATKIKKVKKVTVVGYDFEIALEGNITLWYDSEKGEWSTDYFYIIINGYVGKRWEKGYKMLGVGFSAGVSIGSYAYGLLQVKKEDETNYSGIIRLTPTASLYVDGDFKVASVRGSLTAKLPAEIHFPTGYIGADVSVDAYIGATALLWTKTLYEENFVKLHWENGKEEVALRSLQRPMEEKAVGGNTGAQLMSRDYLARPSQWLGETSGFSALRSSHWMGNENNPQITGLMENIFPEADTALVVNGSQQWVFWSDDNPLRDAVNRTQLRFAIRQDGVWRSPEWLYDDGTADFAPVAAAAGNGVLLAWHNIGRALTGEEGLEDMLASSEISVTEGIYTADGGKPEVIRLTDDDKMDHSPRLAADDGKALLVWSKSENLGFDLDTGTGAPSQPGDKFYFSSWKNAAWTSPAAIPMDFATVLDSSLVMKGEEALLLYTADMDNDLSTGNDREVFARRYDGNEWHEAIRLTSNALNDSSPKAVKVDGKWLITWLTDGKISYKAGLDGETRAEDCLENIQADYRIAAGEGQRPLAALVYTQPGEGLDLGLYASFYDFDNGTWSDKIRLAGDNKYTGGISAAFDENGRLNAVFTQADIIIEAKLREVDGVEKLVEVDSISDKVSLQALAYTPVHDVALLGGEGISLSTEFPLPGALTTVYATLCNGGDFAETVVVDLYDGDPANGGKKVAQTSPQLIPARSSGEVEIPWLVGPEDQYEYDLYAVARPGDGVQEINTGNNMVSLKVSAADIAVAGVTCENPAADQYLIHVTISNRGSKVLEGAKVYLEDETGGEVLETTSLKTLALGEETVLAYMLPSGGQKNLRVRVVLADGIHEDNTGNNSRSFVLEPAAFVLKSFNIEPGAQQVDVASVLRFDFNMPIGQGAGFDRIRLIDEEFNAIAINKVIENSILTLQPQNPLAYRTEYRLIIPADALGDAYGHALERELDMRFSTMTTHPEILAAYPGDGMVNAALNTPIRLKFNQNVTKSNGFSQIALYKHGDGSDAEAIPVSASISGDFLDVNYGGRLIGNTAYTLEVPREAVENDRGEIPEGDFLLAFTTGPEEEEKEEENHGNSGNQVSSGDHSYKAIVSIDGTDKTLSVQKEADSAVIRLEALAKEIFAGKQQASIEVPSVPGVNCYRLEMPAEALALAGGASLTVNTALGSVRLPAGMLSTMNSLQGKTAGIVISSPDRSQLSDTVKAAIGSRPVVRLRLLLDGVETGWNNPATPVWVSIPYKPGRTELENQESIVIGDIDANGNILPIPNGLYRQASGAVSFAATHFGDYAIRYNKAGFVDVARNAWYSKAVSFIAAREITSGTGGGKYSPEARLKRGEFIVLMMRAYGISPDENAADNFTDSGNTYYTAYLAAAKRLGITAGVGNNRYAPEKEITREEMFTLLYNALKVIGKLPRGDSGKRLSDFTDAGHTNAWAKDALALLVRTGIVSGSGDGILNPSGTTTRAQMAQVLFNLLTGDQ